MSSFKVYTIIAMLTVVCFIALITMQAMEFNHLNDPSLWPPQ